MDCYLLDIPKGPSIKDKEYFRGERGSKIPMLKEIRRQKLGKSVSKFRHGGGGYKKRPNKFRHLLWTAPYLFIQGLSFVIDLRYEIFMYV